MRSLRGQESLSNRARWQRLRRAFRGRCCRQHRLRHLSWGVHLPARRRTFHDRYGGLWFVDARHDAGFAISPDVNWEIIGVEIYQLTPRQAADPRHQPNYAYDCVPSLCYHIGAVPDCRVRYLGAEVSTRWSMHEVVRGLQIIQTQYCHSP